MQTKQRAERSDKKKRIHPYLDHDTYSHLDKIRQSVNTQKKAISIHDIAEDILEACVQAPEIIGWLMKKYGVPSDHPMYAVKVKENGKHVIKHLFEC
ncbi:hypothetical protein ABEX29_01115 [Brevibacillus porteri]|uniref:hypothetical protein n=1 Tax=Brevibacillus TaxID=55080 RepID=UPI001CA59275|nr:hypothetical protein [Brevibacillus formosus]MBW5471552.1 hypothetical protein [Brevibacillus formosus]